MRSEDKIDVPIIQAWGKDWMAVRIKVGFPDTNEFIPSFKDWFRMIQALCQCEEGKYPYLADARRLPR